MSFLGKYLKDRAKIIIVFLLFCLIFIFAILLYKVPVGAALYPAAVCTSIGIVFIIFDYKKAHKKHKLLENNKTLSSDLMEYFPEIKTIDDEDYQQIIELIRQEQKQRSTQYNIKYADMVEYYTIWAHQIKTPIAAMSLKLQNEDSELSRSIAEDLSRIEQYVEMVLMFLRLDSDYTDYVIQQYSLDCIVKDSVKKFAPQFIRKKIRLDYQKSNITVLTDEKWLSFVIEQVLSNALKYTSSGTISVYLENPKTLCIKDTGIGIAPEDLPRVFDKGYTGYNGRSDKRASGIGLYLCHRICTNLGHTITAESILDEGTTIKINLDKEKLELE
ncbi:MAG: sensor histidine kinase [Eubacterium sp.]|nr:sensor histidine kinase [Eubacterium sp.]